MAAIKKKAAAKKTTQTKSEEQPKKVLPPLGPDEYTFIMSANEVYSLVQVLSFSRDIFKQMSLNCAVEGDAKGEAAYAARSELSEILFTKLRTIASIGEPTSRAFH
jgi:hypothetical protein